ncbi:MAG: cytidylate kinase family protein [Candidatus Thermoplasmatota archaeon]|jgi:predicted cytidylate kinase|nr:cytidylate kinase family protein [Candidatus Thermoplasmatota archaeon]MCL5794210.1 cytidylate kinase family protein [Candidatus Thermoplasmatota archaeon]
MKITLSGPIGSGKTTVGRIVAEKLEIPFVSGGMIFRENARKRNMSVEQFVILAESDPEIDRMQDQEMLRMLRGDGQLVLESRLAGWLAYTNDIKAYKVFVDASPDIRVSRIAERFQGSMEQARINLEVRDTSDLKRYRDYYGIDYRYPGYYDLIIDSSNLSPEEGADRIYAAIKGTC